MWQLATRLAQETLKKDEEAQWERAFQTYLGYGEQS